MTVDAATIPYGTFAMAYHSMSNSYFICIVMRQCLSNRRPQRKSYPMVTGPATATASMLEVLLHPIGPAPRACTETVTVQVSSSEQNVASA